MHALTGGLFNYVFATITRARIRTLLTVVGVTVGMALFGLVRAMDHGMRSLNAEVSQPDMLLVFERNTICPFQARMPQRYDSQIASIAGVEEVLPVRLYMNSCRANLDLITLYGVPGDEVDRFFPKLGVSPAALQRFKERGDGALLGSRVAQRRGLTPGEEVQVGPVTTSIVGEFSADEAGFLDNVIFMHLDHLLLSMPGGDENLGVVTQHFVRLSDDADAEVVSRQIDEMLARDEAPTKTRPLAEFVGRALAEIEHVISFAQLLGYVAVAVMALILANTVFMSAQARRAEFGVLQVIGTTRRGLFGAVVAESIALAIVGALLGLGAVTLFLTAVPMGIGVEGYQVDFIPGADVVVQGLILAVIIGALAGIGPAVQSATSPIHQALRPE
jgi:putative ABC transport system permease protein